MSEDETLERGVFFEQLCTVGSNIVDGSRGCERAGEAPGILLFGGGRGVL